MISVFSGFIMEDDNMIKMMGFGLAIAVLFDAFVVRMAIVPAIVLALLGTKAWWLPKWLDRLLPNVDVEARGSSTSELGDTTAPPEPARGSRRRPASRHLRVRPR